MSAGQPVVIDAAAQPKWTSQQPFVVTEFHLNARWSGHPSGSARARIMLSCGFCFHRFELGDVCRWICVPGRVSNTFVCRSCDSLDIRGRWAAHWSAVVQPILDRWGS